ncbi:uncharacterized protein LOC122004208 [Zingiber officinale]|uniref:uncharacterized protein LOC122004208 n=1 Tax=Zingiber officinale TaxID=94328 RepID=UPI001C4AEB2E|nr:uncharacterized protein LOC122004208 [Zingiber officinale]
MKTPLYSFIGNEVLSIGQARLAILLEEKPLKRTKTTNFIVVDVLSAYNVILGRLTLNKFQVVVSTFCQKIKFLVDNEVAEVKGDQLTTRQCYVEMVKSEARATRKNQHLDVNAIMKESPPPALFYEEKEEV